MTISKKIFVIGVIVIISVILSVASLNLIKTPSISRDFSTDARLAGAMGSEMQVIFNKIKLFKQDSGYIPPEDNKSMTRALTGGNKLGKNYLLGWDDNGLGPLLDSEDRPFIFHFINDNEITIYCQTTRQQLHGFLDTGSESITQESSGVQK